MEDQKDVRTNQSPVTEKKQDGGMVRSKEGTRQGHRYE